MPGQTGDKRYRPMPGFSKMNQSRRLALAQFEKRDRSSFQQKSFLYRVQIVTTDRRSGMEVYRTLNVTEKERSTIQDVLNAARDIIMESPVASREDFSRAELTGAFHNPFAPNVD